LSQTKPKKKAHDDAKPAPKRAAPGSDPTRVVHAEFLAGAAPGGTLPPPTVVEIAFGGRSNVGKSSLINTLCDRRGLVRTSSTPGSTRQVNLYDVRTADGASMHLVDLPGYGFAKRSKVEARSWGGLIEGYLSTRVTLAALVLIVDVRRGLEDEERDLAEFLAQPSVVTRRTPSLLLVATKIDKLSKSERAPAIARIAADGRARAYGFSAETGEGKTALWAAVRRAAFGEDALAPPA
jgi:GTP-binding protein